MQIGMLSGANSMWDLASIQKVNEDTRFSSIANQTTSSGDRVDISDEARELYSKMIHKYDKSSVSTETGDPAATNETGNGASAPVGGGGEASADNVTKIKEQIQALKSQIMALAGQAAQQGPGSAAASQMSALESQIAALEAQLNEMAAA